MKIVAFMQNQWLHNPEKHRASLARYDDDIPRREKLRRRMIAYALFSGCKSGRVLKQALGEELCEKIIWEESSREIGDHSASSFPPDIEHIRSVITAEQPDAIISFGKIAARGVNEALRGIGGLWSHVHAPHPAARHPTVMTELLETKFLLDYLAATHSA